MKYSGQVQKVSSFDYNNKKLWSFTLKGNKPFFRTGTTHPNVEADQSITFEGDPDPKGNVNVDTKSIAKSTEVQAVGVASAVKGSLYGSGNRDFPTESERDATQKRIEIQSCRNSALELVGVLLAHGDLKIPAKTNKVEFIEALLQHYTKQFIKENAGGSDTPASVETAESPAPNVEGGYN